MNKDELHKYQGSGPICSLCYKTPMNAIHGVDFNADELDGVRNAVREITPIESTPQLIIETPPKVQNTIPLEHKNKESPNILTEDIVLCYGHKCPSCGRAFSHAYKCWPGTTEVLHCPDCHAQATAEIHRPDDILQLLKKDYMTAREITEILIEHEAFVVRNIIRDENNELRSDYEERVAAHILNMEQMSVALNAKKQATRKALVDA